MPYFNKKFSDIIVHRYATLFIIVLIFYSWSGFGPLSSGLTTPESEILVYDIHTSNIRCIHYSRGNPLEVSIYEEYIVWEYNNRVYNYSNNSYRYIGHKIWMKPKIYNNTIIWLNTAPWSRYDFKSISVYNISSDQNRTYFLKQNASIYDCDIFENIIVYCGTYPSNDTYYYGYIDLNTGIDRIFFGPFRWSDTSGIVSYSRVDPRMISIYEDKVVFTSDKSGKWEIYMYNLSTGKCEIISEEDQTESVWPVIYGNFVLWGALDYYTYEGKEHGVVRSLYLHDLSNNTTRCITAQKELLSYDIYGDNVVYALWADRYPPRSINILYNISSDTAIEIDLGNVSKSDSARSNYVERVRIFKNLIVFAVDISGGGSCIVGDGFCLSILLAISCVVIAISAIIGIVIHNVLKKRKKSNQPPVAKPGKKGHRWFRNR